MSKHLNLKGLNRRSIRVVLSTLLVSILLVTVFSVPKDASAHCDSYQGPVVQAAIRALDQGNVNLILPYVKPDDEAELAAAFKQAREIRKISPESKKLADQYFFETAVRLHRQGEGAVYAGLTNEQVPASIVAADKAMQSGNLAGVNTMLADALKKGVAEKYQAVVEARENAEKLNTLAAQRERAEAELMFEKYVYEVYTLAAGGGGHAEGAAPAGGHTH